MFIIKSRRCYEGPRGSMHHYHLSHHHAWNVSSVNFSELQSLLISNFYSLDILIFISFRL